MILKLQSNILKEELYFEYEETPLSLNQFELPQVLLDAYENVNDISAFYESVKRSDETPLSIAIRSDQFEVAQFLLDHGTDVNDLKAFYAAAMTKDIKYLRIYSSIRVFC